MMFSLAIAARRTAPTMMNVARRPLSSQALAQVQDLESMFQTLHWADTKDTVHEIRQLMNENKTNHAVNKPDEVQVCNRMKDIQEQLLHGNPSHDAVQAEILGLKRMIKSQLYGQN